MPELRPGDIVIIEDLSSHNWARCEREDRSRRCHPALPSALQPRLQSIEKALFRLRDILHKAGKRTVRSLWKLIGRLDDIFQPDECVTLLQFGRL